MKEHPILFSGPMVRAILDGRKTQTRRVIKPQPDAEHPAGWSPYGQPGDRLWVRETWGPCDGGFCYRASECEGVKPDDGKWHPAIHMFREASRITLELDQVRVERVQEITNEDALCEGVDPKSNSGNSSYTAFAALWDSINAKRGFGWDKNPWVWVLKFKRV